VRLPNSRLGWIATAPYFALLLAAVGYLLYRIAVAPGSSELAAAPLVVLSLPWSILGTAVGESVGLWVGFLGGLILNGIMCYRLGQAVERRRRGSSAHREPTPSIL
jgi:hypothetical protein